MDLRALLDEALGGSPRLRAIRARSEAAGKVASREETLPDPLLTASYTNDGLSGFTLGSSEFTNLTLSWEQEVPRKQARRSAAEIAGAQQDVLRGSGRALEAETRERVIVLYAEIWKLDRTRVLLEEDRTLLASAASAAGARYESGEGVQESVLRAQSAVRVVELQLSELALSRRQSEIALGEALGRTGDVEFGEARDLPQPIAIDTGKLADAAAELSPQVAEVTSRERSAGASLEAARVATKPVYSWMAAYQFRGGLDPMVMGGMSVRLPIWKDRKQEQAIVEAELSRQAASSDRDDAIVHARSGVRSLAAEVASIDERLRLYREGIVPQRIATYESAQAAFSSGRAEMSLVLDDLARAIEARKDVIALEAQRVGTIASLEAITGQTLFTWSGTGRQP